MGRVGARLSDRTIVTDDNPRNEDAAKIRADILKDCSDAIEIGDRAEAIAFGINQLGDGDALLIAGKGHETSQILGGRAVDFDDAAIVRATIGYQGS
jgi:UDP-N-acetylmuramoyl-L-alanyl-D-glutamate--2,6-diaminopimelate ligase